MEIEAEIKPSWTCHQRGSRVRPAACVPPTGRSSQQGDLGDEADLQGEGEGDDGEVLHGVPPCPASTEERPAYFGSPPPFW
jgi:hypothetical protein